MYKRRACSSSLDRQLQKTCLPLLLNTKAKSSTTSLARSLHSDTMSTASDPQSTDTTDSVASPPPPRESTSNDPEIASEKSDPEPFPLLTHPSVAESVVSSDEWLPASSLLQGIPPPLPSVGSRWRSFVGSASFKAADTQPCPEQLQSLIRRTVYSTD